MEYLSRPARWLHCTHRYALTRGGMDALGPCLDVFKIIVAPAEECTADPHIVGAYTVIPRAQAGVEILHAPDEDAFGEGGILGEVSEDIAGSCGFLEDRGGHLEWTTFPGTPTLAIDVDDLSRGCIER
jgi:hypothetical protein